MDLPTRRERRIIEIVVEIGDAGIDAKTFSRSYAEVHRQANADGVDLSYDDAYKVTANDGELVFSYESKFPRDDG